MGEPDKVSSTGSPAVDPGEPSGLAIEKYASITTEAEANKPHPIAIVNYKLEDVDNWGYIPRTDYTANTQNLLGAISPDDTYSAEPIFLHSLVIKRFNAMKEAWLREVPSSPPFRIAKGWEPHEFENNLQSYHNRCAKQTPPKFLLSDPYGDGAANPEKIGKEGGRCDADIPFTTVYQMGLAVDFSFHDESGSPIDTGKANEAKQKASDQYQWLQGNAHRFGFTPVVGEPWHWEVNMPVDAWATAEEFAIDENYAIRVDESENLKKKKPKEPELKQGERKCKEKSTVGRKNPAEEFKNKGTQPSEMGDLAQTGTKFEGLETRKIADIKNVVLNETGGGFGKILGPEGVPGGKEHTAVFEMTKSGHSVHFTIGKDGVAEQHAKLEEVAKHSSDKINKASIAIEFINPILVNKSDAKKILDEDGNAFIIKKGKLSSSKKEYYLFLSQTAVESCYDLIEGFVGKCENLEHKYPCIGDEDAFKLAADTRHKESKGIFGNIRSGSKKEDGSFAEWYCAHRKALEDEDTNSLYLHAVAAFISGAKGNPIPKPGESVDYGEVGTAVNEAKEEIKAEPEAESGTPT